MIFLSMCACWIASKLFIISTLSLSLSLSLSPNSVYHQWIEIKVSNAVIPTHRYKVYAQTHTCARSRLRRECGDLVTYCN